MDCSLVISKMKLLMVFLLVSIVATEDIISYSVLEEIDSLLAQEVHCFCIL